MWGFHCPECGGLLRWWGTLWRPPLYLVTDPHDEEGALDVLLSLRNFATLPGRGHECARARGG